MTDYTWPSEVIPTSSEWQLVANTAAFTSPLTGATRTLARGGDRWACTLTCNNLNADKRAVLQAFLARLRGQAHRVLLTDHAFRRRGTQTADVLVKGANQTGVSLIVDGATVGATLKAGDLVSIGYALHMVVTDATANGSGEMTLAITPPLRAAPSDNATVSVASPLSRFLLSSNTVAWSNEPGGKSGTISSFTVELIEDIAQ